MEGNKYRVCYGNFELRRSQIPRNCDDYDLKNLAHEKAESENYETLQEFENIDDAVNELHKHKSDIREAQFYVGSGYCGTVWWVEEYNDEGTLNIIGAEWE